MSAYAKKKVLDPDKNPFYERCECKVFVGGVPLDTPVQEFRDFVHKWGYNTLKTYYKDGQKGGQAGPGGTKSN